MKRSATAAVFLLIAALPLTAQDHSGQYPAADIAAGSRIYYANCAPCHGPTGTSVGGIDLRRGRLPRAPTDDALAALVASGIPGTGMPPFRLAADDMRGLIAFVRGGLGTDPNAPPVKLGNAARGRAVFEGAGKCAAGRREPARLGVLPSAFSLLPFSFFSSPPGSAAPSGPEPFRAPS